MKKYIRYFNRSANVVDKKIVLGILRKMRATSILETGCGDGDFLLEAKKITGATRVEGIEIDPQAIKQAHNKKLKVSTFDLNKDIPLSSNTFDCILSLQVIEHLYFTDKYLEECKRMLKKNGRIIITTTNLAAWQYRLMLLFGMLPMCLHPSIYQTFPLRGKNPLYGHHSIFTHKALEEVCYKHGFDVVQSYTHSIYFLPRWISTILCSLRPWGTFSCIVLGYSGRQPYLPEELEKAIKNH